VVSLTGQLPLRPQVWIKDPEHLKALPLQATAKVNQLAISRLQVFAPKLSEIQGSLDATLEVGGTTANPMITGQARARMKQFPLPENTPYRNIRDADLKLRLKDRLVTVEPSSALVAGGKLSLSGTIDLEGEAPKFDLRLGADHALLWRNDSFVLRSDGDLRLSGPWASARLSGSIAFVESVYYKDIEIIPLEVPTTSAPKPRLPTFDRKESGNNFDLPAPFNAWTLDLSVSTKDSILIRGNVARGKIEADAHLRGTLANPRPSGKFTVEKVTADLPFSTLQIENGTLTLRPDAPLDPLIDIRGTSVVNSQQVNLYLYGSLNDPKYNLSSDRGLPENEILTLLATGTTAADLEDPEVAKSKAFQVFLDDLRRRANKPGGNRLFREVLNELDDVDLKVGENDPFSGRKFNSATLKLEDRWYLSAAVDGQGNTRGLVIFSMRFK
jgi:autotransporter translocation and assembly factor TamB